MNFQQGHYVHLPLFKDPVARRAAVEMVDLARVAPGSSYRDLLRHVSTGKIRSQMIREYLVEVGVLIEEEVLGARRIFPAHFHDATARQQVAVLRDADVVQLYRVLSKAVWRQRDLFREMESCGLNREKVRRGLAKLQGVGLVRQGEGTARFPTWSVAPMHPLAFEQMRCVWDDCWFRAHQNTLHR